MQNKGAIRLFAIALALVSIFQLWFTVETSMVEKDAKEFAKGDAIKERAYLDSISGEVVYNFLGLRKYTYAECKEKEINLGLDLKGGMNVTLEVSVPDIIKSMANNSQDTTFVKAINLAKQMQKNSQDDFVTLFGKAFEQVDPNAKMAAVFNTVEMKDKINFNSTNDDVLKVLRTESQGAIDNSFNVLRTRIDRFGVTQPNIQQLETSGRILVELPGVKDPERVRKLLQGTAQLEFWETYENGEAYTFLEQANTKIKEINDAKSSLKQAVDTAKVVASAEKAVETKDKKDTKATKTSKDAKAIAKLDSAKADSAKKLSLFLQYPLQLNLFPNGKRFNCNGYCKNSRCFEKKLSIIFNSSTLDFKRWKIITRSCCGCFSRERYC